MSFVHFTPGQLAALACAWEVAAPKPGNVHRAADFDDATLYDFLTAGIGLGHSLDRHLDRPVGQLILECTRDARGWSGTNLNLGMILLLAPLAKCCPGRLEGPLTRERVTQLLDTAGVDQCEQVFAAIRESQPGGLGETDRGDVHRPATHPLRETMCWAADRDLVARQLAHGYREVFECVVPDLEQGVKRFGQLDRAIVYAHVRSMAHFPDSLIARKCGPTVAREAATRAARVLDQLAETPSPAAEEIAFWREVGELDFWLRSDGHRRNPGTTADLIAAGLFIALATGKITFP